MRIDKQKKYKLIGLLYIVSIFVGVIAYQYILGIENDHYKNTFIDLSASITSNLKNALQKQVDICESTTICFSENVSITKNRFIDYSSKAQSRHSEINSVYWFPQVLEKNRVTFVDSIASNEANNFRIKQRTKNNYVIAAHKNSYYPILYSYPSGLISASLGEDMSNYEGFNSILDSLNNNVESIFYNLNSNVDFGTGNSPKLFLFTKSKSNKNQGVVLFVIDVNTVYENTFNHNELDKLYIRRSEKISTSNTKTITGFDEKFFKENKKFRWIENINVAHSEWQIVLMPKDINNDKWATSTIFIFVFLLIVTIFAITSVLFINAQISKQAELYNEIKTHRIIERNSLLVNEFNDSLKSENSINQVATKIVQNLKLSSKAEFCCLYLKIKDNYHLTSLEFETPKKLEPYSIIDTNDVSVKSIFISKDIKLVDKSTTGITIENLYGRKKNVHILAIPIFDGDKHIAFIEIHKSVAYSDSNKHLIAELVKIATIHFNRTLLELKITEIIAESNLKSNELISKNEEIISLKKKLGDKITELNLSEDKNLIYSNELGKKNSLLLWQKNKLKETIEKTKTESVTLEQSNNSLKEFASIASHDLQAPLKNISSFVALIKQEKKPIDSPNFDNYLNYIEKGVEHMQLLIKDLLLFSSITNSNFQKQEINLTQIVLEELDNYSNEKHVFELKHEGLNIIQGVKSQINSMVSNLLSNAYKYSLKTEGQKIQIFILNVDSKVLFIINDNGIGIDNQYLEEIFVPFKRFCSDPQVKGTGIGLSIVKKVVDLHDGDIIVKSELNKGTSIEVTFPL